MLKKILSLSICLSLLGSTAIASAAEVNSNDASSNLEEKVTDNVNSSATKSVTIKIKRYTYKNAPEELRKKYEEDCKAINKIPNDNDEIIDTANSASKVKSRAYSVSDTYESVNIAYDPFAATITITYPNRSYTIDMYSTYVGYGHIEYGNAVEAAQLLLDIYANRNGITPIAIDKIFGPKTQGLVYNYQSFKGLGYDGVVGPETWNSLICYVLL